jgi:hypothetical protein
MGLLALAILALSSRWLDQQVAVRSWLAWILLTIWGWQVVLAGSLFLAGHAVVVRLLGIRPRSLAELLALAMPAGALAFTTGIFVAGFVGCLRPAFALVWPPGLAALALWLDRDHLSSARRRLRRYWPRPGARDPFWFLATGFGLISLGLTYLQALSPSSITYDAAWTHLTIAQDYAREARIVPFLADWPKTLPHLGSVINTWSFLVPGLGSAPAKWMMALHTEIVFLLWTIAGVAAVMQRLGGYRPGAWVAAFLFPAFFLYDHRLGGGADHFLAFWSAPVLLALYETATTRAVRWWLMLAIVLSGAIMTKAQAVIMIVPAAVVLVAVLARDSLRRCRARRAPASGKSRRKLWIGPLAAAGTALVLTAPQFGANLVHHNNPFYPFAQRVFTRSTPTISDAALFADNVLRGWGSHPPATLAKQVRSLAVAVVTFPCHSEAPESGVLFAAALGLVLLLPRSGPLWFGLLFALGSLAVWNLTYPQTRNLQGVLPVFAAVTGAVLVRALRLGRLARLGVGMLLCFQVVAGFDLLFADPEHIADAVALARGSRDGRAAGRFDGYRQDYVALGRSLPEHAVVLMHTMHVNLGIDRTILHDGLGFQSLIDPRTFRTARDLYLRLKEIGVTHVVYEPHGAAASTRQGEAVFDAFAAPYRDTAKSFGSMRVFPMPAEAPPVEPDYQVLLVGISEQPDGLYPVADLRTLEDLPPSLRVRSHPGEALTESNGADLAARARVVLRGHDAGLTPAIAERLSERFDLFASYGDLFAYVRRP